MRRRPSLSPALAAAVLAGLFGLAGCDASGSVQGGQSLIADACEATDGGHTWTDLYTCYFGPMGKASCSAQAACHASYPQGSVSGFNGATTSLFVCGSTKEECWYGMTHAYDAGATADAAIDSPADAPPEAAPDAAADARMDAPGDARTDAEGDADGGEGGGGTITDPCAASIPPIVCGSDPASTALWSALQKPGELGKGTRNNMPCAQPSQACPPSSGSYTFTSADLARISAWIKEGAQDN